MSIWRTNSVYGFTIVELLIVVVVIAILAAISSAAYGGMQQRARNTVTITAAEQSIKLLQLYKTTNGEYPSPFWLACIGEYDDDVCMYYNGGDIEAQESVAFKAVIATVGTMPQPSKEKFTLLNNRTGGGVMYFGGVSPRQLRYYLAGANQVCSAGGAASSHPTATMCAVELP